MNKIRWSKEELEYLRQNAGSFTDDKLAKEMSVLFNRPFTRNATRKQRQRLGGLKKEGHRGHFKIKEA